MAVPLQAAQLVYSVPSTSQYTLPYGAGARRSEHTGIRLTMQQERALFHCQWRSISPHPTSRPVSATAAAAAAALHSAKPGDWVGSWSVGGLYGIID